MGKSIQLTLLERMGLLYQDSASRVSWHSHEGFEILFILEGATVYEFKSGLTVELHGGDFLMIPPKVVHRGQHEVRSPCRICGLALASNLERAWRNTTFTRANLRHLNQSLKQAAMEVHPLNRALRDVLERLMAESDRYWIQKEDAVSQATLRNLICAALLEAVQQIQLPSTKPDFIAAAAMEHLSKNYLEPVSIEELTQFLGYSRTRTYELFKSQTGLTPKDYLQRLRVQKAEELLCKTERPITEIAHAVGFSSSQYFSTVFRRYTGQTPAGFRQENKNSNAAAR